MKVIKSNPGYLLTLFYFNNYLVAFVKSKTQNSKAKLAFDRTLKNKDSSILLPSLLKCNWINFNPPENCF